MNRKIIPALGLLLALQLLLVILVFRPDSGQDTPPGALLAGVKAESIRQLLLTDDYGVHLTLSKKDDSHWHVTLADNKTVPADEAQVTRMIDALVALKAQRLVTRTKSSHIRLQVDDRLFARRVALVDTRGKQHILFLGSSPGQQSIHVRADGASDVFLAEEIALWQLAVEGDNWIKRDYVMVDRAGLKEVRLQNSHGELRLIKESDAWFVHNADNGQNAATDPKEIDDFLQRATRITAHEYQGQEQPSTPLDAALLTLVEENETLTVAIGEQQGDEKLHTIKASHSPWYVTVSDFQIQPLLERSAKSLLAHDAQQNPSRHENAIAPDEPGN